MTQQAMANSYLSDAVFTASQARFEHIYDRTRSGILNRNRSTNLASPRLPFGGLGKSGNYRPTGAWAARSPWAESTHRSRAPKTGPWRSSIEANRRSARITSM